MRRILAPIFTILALSCLAQVDHWETIITEGSSWQYLVPSSEPASNWTALNYNDNFWDTGNSGFGYGDDDDATSIDNIISIYLRKEFQVTDLTAIDRAIFHLDFDDGFVAYLNGTEIARAFANGNPPAFDQPSAGLHEAELYLGGRPAEFGIPLGLLNQGNNVLAIQVHNESLTSSDMSAIPFLTVGINDSSSDYGPTPDWFNPPISFENSNLPIVKINTFGQNIGNQVKTRAVVGIIYNGPGAINSFSETPNEYAGFCGIKIRGESSQNFDKKSYGFETWDENNNDIDTSFLNFGSEEDFILYGPYSDKTLINNVMAMHIGNEMGHYASQTRLVEVCINEDYQGVYVLMEKIKRDKQRVDIAKLTTEDVEGDDLTGGYIVRIDKGEYDGWFSEWNIFSNNNKLYFQFYYPNEDEILDVQKQYIQNYVDGFEIAIRSNFGIHPNGKHYTEYINLRSFVDNFIINELSKNVDAYRLSTYFHKDKDSKGGKFTAGPFWDFNLSFGNGDYCSGDDVTGWEYYQCTGNSPFWWDRFLNDDTFKTALKCRWESLRSTLLSDDNLEGYIDSLANSLSEAQERNFQKWPILGQYIWPNPSYFVEAQSHAEVIIALKNWMAGRLEWMDDNMPGIATNCDLYDEDFELTTSVEEIDLLRADFQIFPNPTQQGITIKGEERMQSIAIHNSLGQLMWKKNVDDKEVYLPMSANFAPGIYQLRITTELGNFTQTIILEE